MTEQDKGTDEGQDQEAMTSDWFLRSLVRTVNEAKTIEFGITLAVPGGVITGTLISGKQYFELFADLFSGAWENEETRQGIRESYMEYAKVYDLPAGESPPVSPSFIHMKNARYVSSSGQMPTGTGLLWRGKISAVSGFSLGSLSVARP